jgi:type IV secretory pathway VirJ component
VTRPHATGGAALDEPKGQAERSGRRRPASAVHMGCRVSQSWTIRARGVALLIAALSLGSPVVYAQLDSKPGVYVFRKVRMLAAPLELDMTLVTPVAPKTPVVLILFASGDGGLRGVSKAVVQHMADQGYYIAAFSSPDALEELRQEDGKLRYAIALASLTSVVGQAKRALKLPDDTPLVVTGMSRGASLVVAVAANPTFRAGMAGGVAMALTRELDYIYVPEGAEKTYNLAVDAKRRVQVYPAIERMGATPLAVIQANGDKYVTSAESRKLLGPDTDTRRLYEIKDTNHSFSGAQDTLMRDLDDALRWVLSKR